MPVAERTAEELASSFVRVMKIMAAMRQHAPRHHQAVDPSHYPLLFNLSREPRRVSGLAECVHSDVSTVSRQISHLVQHGLVEKIGDPQDGRAQLLSLTPEGCELIDRLVRGRGAWFGKLLASWSEADASTLLALLTRFGDDVEAYKGALAARSMNPSGTATKEH